MNRSRARTVLLLALGAALGFPGEARAASISPGSGEQVVEFDGSKFEVFTYRPRGCANSSLLLVFHGLARNADGYRDYARKLADRQCMVVIAPRFDQHRFPGWAYQLGGIVRNGAVRNQREWTVNLVNDIVAWGRQATRLTDYALIGHSAGGQFLGRVAAFVPTEATRIVIANPSTYVLPSTDVQAPYGLGLVYSGSAATDALRRYLAQPVTIFLGEDDTDDEAENLSKTPEAMAQGETRLERGLNTFRAGQQLAAKRGWTFNWRLVQVPGVGHSARRMLSSPEIEEALQK